MPQNADENIPRRWVELVKDNLLRASSIWHDLTPINHFKYEPCFSANGFSEPTIAFNRLRSVAMSDGEAAKIRILANFCSAGILPALFIADWKSALRLAPPNSLSSSRILLRSITSSINPLTFTI
jgi:hypothetical protein